jgi:hypothetical protein
MPFKTADADTYTRSQSRIMIAGDPNSGKTRSLLTWPRPLHVIAYPGEKGSATIRHNPAEGVHVYIYEGGKTGVNSADCVRELRQLVTDILTGKMGACETIACDGVHKFFDYLLDVATAGDYLEGNEFEPRLYVPAQREFQKHLDTVTFSAVPNVVFTCWSGQERDSVKKEIKTTHIWPDLPGKTAKRILGEFTATLYATVRPAAVPGGEPQFVWQLKPDDQVWGVGIKVPDDVRASLPKYIPQDWKVLMDTLNPSSTSKAHSAKGVTK